MPQKESKVFWSIVVIGYALAVVLSFLKIYVYHAYPIYYSEDDMPDMAGEIIDAANFLHL